MNRAKAKQGRHASAATAARDVMPAAAHGADAWATLNRQWQQQASQWTDWWTRTITDANAPARRPGPVPASSPLPQRAPVFTAPTVTIDPGKAAALNEAYALKFEALWANALVGGGFSAPAGGPVIPGDRRFAGKLWHDEPYYAWLKNAYLLYSQYIGELVTLAEADAETRNRLAFIARQYTDAIAPSNFLATNPEALQLALTSGGMSIAKGFSNLVADTQRGRIAMSDESAYVVGGNLAITPGSVVFRNDLIELIQYAPSTAKVYKRPLLIVPPCINKYYILDLQPENSFVRYAVAEGHTVFIISWRNVPASLGHLTWDDYLEQGVLTAIRLAKLISGSATINTLGFCVGGTLLSCALAVLAARRDASVTSVTLLTTMLDFSDPGDIGVYVSSESLAAREPELCAGGRVQGSELAGAFASLRANELVWNYVVANYLKGQTPPAFDLLYWNGDSANLAGPMYVEYLRDMYIDNKLREPNALTMCQSHVDLGRIVAPAYVYASRDDHIVPWRTAYRNVGLLGGDVTFTLGASGHIAGVINPPAKKRRNYWINDLLTDTAEDWLARADTQAGSWWPHWAAWLAKFGGSQRAAPPAAGNRAFPVLGPAPGDYVKEESGDSIEEPKAN